MIRQFNLAQQLAFDNDEYCCHKNGTFIRFLAYQFNTRMINEALEKAGEEPKKQFNMQISMRKAANVPRFLRNGIIQNMVMCEIDYFLNIEIKRNVSWGMWFLSHRVGAK